jgi:hypothetical protein
VRSIIELWRYNRRSLLVGGGLLLGLLALLGVVAVLVRASGGPISRDAQSHLPTTPTSSVTQHTGVSPSDAAPPTDVASWDALPAVTPAVSKAYPAIAASARRDPDAYARAFATELFTRDYRAADRGDLMSWAQYENAPLRSPNYPRADWTKVLVDSLTDLTWDAADDTPIPADGPWLAARSEHAKDSVSTVKVSLDPQWEQQVANGYQPPDPLTTVRDVSLTVTEHAEAAGRPSVSTFAVSLSLQLGSSSSADGYGVAATNNYVIKVVG